MTDRDEDIRTLREALLPFGTGVDAFDRADGTYGDGPVFERVGGKSWWRFTLEDVRRARAALAAVSERPAPQEAFIPESHFVPEGDERCNAKTDTGGPAPAVCLLRKGHDGPHRNTQGYWRNDAQGAARQGYDLPVREHPYVREIEARLRMACEPCAECGHIDYRELDDVLNGEPTTRYTPWFLGEAPLPAKDRCFPDEDGSYPCDPMPNNDGTATCRSCGWTGGWDVAQGASPAGGTSEEAP